MFETPALYWWQFCQILCIYCSLIGFICTFMRRYFPTEEPHSQNERYDKKTGIALEPQEAPDANYNMLKDFSKQAEKKIVANEQKVKDAVIENVKDNMQIKPSIGSDGKIAMNVEFKK